MLVAGNDLHVDRQSIDFARDFRVGFWLQRVAIYARAMLIAEIAETT
jgi:hypothetical protein